MKKYLGIIGGDDIFMIFVVGIAVALWAKAGALDPPFDIYPKLTVALLGLFAVLGLIQNRKTLRNDSDLRNGTRRWSFIATVAGLFVYILAIGGIGYFVSTFVYLSLFFLLRRKAIAGWGGITPGTVTVDLALAGALVATIAVVFKVALKLVFPEALLF